MVSHSPFSIHISPPQSHDTLLRKGNSPFNWAGLQDSNLYELKNKPGSNYSTRLKLLHCLHQKNCRKILFWARRFVEHRNPVTCCLATKLSDPTKTLCLLKYFANLNTHTIPYSSAC